MNRRLAGVVLAALALAMIGPMARAEENGIVMVSGTGQGLVQVKDGAGNTVGSGTTNSEIAVPAGEYTVVLNQTPRPALVEPGKKTVLSAGTLLVSGSGANRYSVYDEQGQVLGSAPTNSEIELFPGTYVVELGGSRQTVVVEAGNQLAAGRLRVFGPGAGRYELYDSDEQQIATALLNQSVELFPGTYHLRLNGTGQTVEVAADQAVSVPAGAIQVRGTGQDIWYVLDAQENRLAYAHTNQTLPLFGGSYLLSLNNTRTEAEVTPPAATELGATVLEISGTGQELFFVKDSSGQQVTYLRTNQPLEVFPDTYTFVTPDGQEQTVDADGEQADLADKDSFEIPVDEDELEAIEPPVIELETEPGQTLTQTIAFDSPGDIHGLSVSGEYALRLRSGGAFLPDDPGAFINLILIDDQNREYLVFEKSYNALSDEEHEAVSLVLDRVCEETCALPQKAAAFSLRAELRHASLRITALSYVKKPVEVDPEVLRARQNAVKIRSYNQKHPGWIAGETELSGLSYSQKKARVGVGEGPASFNLHGLEFYRGGVFSLLGQDGGSGAKRQADDLPDSFDWREQHGQNWITPVRNQGACGSCGIFAVTGAVEALVNLYFNQPIDLDLAEQDIVSCADIEGSSCYELWYDSQGNRHRGRGWSPALVLDHYHRTGVIPEACFPYSATDAPCDERCTNPQERIQIGGKVPFGTGDYPRTEAGLKRMLVENGPISGGIYSLGHAMTLVGYRTDPADGRTVWIFKNSWGANWGATASPITASGQGLWGEYEGEGLKENGYAYIKLDMENVGWTYAVQMPVYASRNRRVRCTDADGDGYCWWGLSSEPPADCSENCAMKKDCDDSDPTIGPCDQAPEPPQPPVARLNISPSTGKAPLSCTLDGGDTYDPDGRIVAYQWAVEGRAIGTGRVIAHTFYQAGDYQVRLTVTDDQGQKAQDRQVVVVAGNQAPVARFTASPEAGKAPLLVALDGGASFDPDGAVRRYDWTFGDGTQAGGPGKAALHTYADPGEYRLVLTVTDDQGLAGSSETRIRVTRTHESDTPPRAELSLSPTQGQVPLTVRLDGSASLDEGEIRDYRWDFGDGTELHGPSAVIYHVYEAPGPYTARLTVTDDGGQTDTARADILAEPVPVNESPRARLRFSPAQGKAPLVVDFDGSHSSDADGRIVSYHWIFGDGTETQGAKNALSHQYQQPGTYTVTLAVTDNGGLTHSQEGTVRVAAPPPDPQPPVARFTLSPAGGNAPLTVTADAGASYDPDGRITAYHWWFGDGAQHAGGESRVQHRYRDPGTYSLRLTVTDDSKQLHTSYQTVTVTADGGDGGGGGCFIDSCVKNGLQRRTDALDR